VYNNLDRLNLDRKLTLFLETKEISKVQKKEIMIESRERFLNPKTKQLG
jgi:hypothetical protein